MKHKISLLITLVILSTIAISQTISPDVNDEYCPNVDITFTVTVPGSSPFVSSWTNSPLVISGASIISSSSSSSTFTFVGKFRDVNINQVFRVNFLNASSQSVFHDFSFKKVKSLSYSTTCSQVANMSAITAPRCQSSNFNISFSNVQWGAAFEIPDLCFGAITNYEYQLPANWILNGQTSTGSNWIAGNNNVTITSDLVTGDGTTIKIRPTNSCGSGLSNGQTVGQIYVSRPAPVLRILNSDTVLCTGSSTHTITGLPSGATVQWSIDNTGDASISNATSSTVTLTRTTTNNSFVNLTATVTHCSFTYTISVQITLGSLYSTHNIIARSPSAEANCFSTYSFHYFAAIFTGGFQSNQYQWSYRVTGSPLETSVSGNSGVAGYFFFPDAGSYDIIVRTGSQCGIVSETVRTIQVCDVIGGGWQLRIALFPNPTKKDLYVEIENIKEQSNKSNNIFNYVYFDLIHSTSTKTVKQWKQLNSQKQFRLNLSGIEKGQYYLITKIGDKKVARQVMIE